VPLAFPLHLLELWAALPTCLELMAMALVSAAQLLWLQHTDCTDHLRNEEPTVSLGQQLHHQPPEGVWGTLGGVGHAGAMAGLLCPKGLGGYSRGLPGRGQPLKVDLTRVHAALRPVGWCAGL
jgi:hypothetical protein